MTAVGLKVELPKPPNYLRFRGLTTGTEYTIPIETLTEEQLRELGAEFTVQLVEHARKRREKDA